MNTYESQIKECKKLQNVRDKITAQIIEMKNREGGILQEIYDEYIPIVIKLTEKASRELNQCVAYIDTGGDDDEYFIECNKKIIEYYSKSIETLVMILAIYKQRKQEESKW